MSNWFFNDSAFETKCDAYLQAKAREFVERVTNDIKNQTDTDMFSIEFRLEDAAGNERFINNATIRKFIVELMTVFTADKNMSGYYHLFPRVHKIYEDGDRVIKSISDVPDVWPGVPSIALELVCKTTST